MMNDAGTERRQRMRKKKTMDMTEGPIFRQLLLFSLPLLLGNAFQQLYNTVDSIVVGNFVGADALGAVTGVMPAINTLVGLFVGMSTGASVVISQYFGAKNDAGLRKSVHTAISATFFLGLAFMLAGYLLCPHLLHLMRTPAEIFPLAVVYLRIYFLGIEGLMFYNMTSAILRAVGDSRRPLIFLIITSLLNVALDLIFVAGFGFGVTGVAAATVISQFVSAALGLITLFKSTENYGISMREMRLNPYMLRRIINIGLPAGLQMAIISFSNVFVQGYINSFGAASTSGWGIYIRIDAFVILPLQTFAMAITTFTGQNAGAGNLERIRQGIRATLTLCMAVTLVICTAEFAAAPFLVQLFNQEEAVVRYGTLFIRLNTMFDVLCAGNQVHACVLRGVGDSRAPMFIMITSFVIFRQIYLFIVTHLTASVIPVAFGYPAGWIVCSVIMLIYFRKSHWERYVKAPV